VWDALQVSVAYLRADVPADEAVFVSLYCHRVLVRPGGVYSGFFIVTINRRKLRHLRLYPRVDAAKLAGASVICRWPGKAFTPSGSPDRELTLPASAYHRSLLLMRYPHNIAMA